MAHCFAGLVGLSSAWRSPSSVLHAGEDVRQHRRHPVDRFVVTEHLHEDAALAFALEVAEGEVVIGALRRRLLRFDLGRHLRVVDAREDVGARARPRRLVERVDLVDDRERPRQANARLLVERRQGRVDRVLEVLDLDRDLRRVVPVVLEVAPNQLVELRPERLAAVDRRPCAVRHGDSLGLCSR